MGHLLYIMFRCDRGCDGKFGKFGNFVGSKHTHYCRRHIDIDNTSVMSASIAAYYVKTLEWSVWCLKSYICVFFSLTCEATIVFFYSAVLVSSYLFCHFFSILSLVFIVIATWQSRKLVAANYGLPYILKFRICLWNLDMYVGFNKWDRLCTRNMQFLMPIIYDGACSLL